MKPIPMFGTGIKGFSATLTAQRRLNCIYSVRVDQDKTSIAAIGTPGSFLSYLVPDSPIRGWIVVKTTLYVVANKTLYAVTIGGGVTAIGSLPTVNQLVCIADSGTQLCIVDGVAGYVHDYTTGIFRGMITDPGFPNGATTVACLDSRFVCEQPNSRFAQVGYQLDGMTWSPILFFTKENYSDQLVAIDQLNGMLVLWGAQQSTEFWQDAALVPQPYQRILGSTQSWGLAAKFSRTKINNTMIFLGQNPDGAIQVLKLNGYTPQRVSSEDIEQIIASFPIFQDAIAFTYTIQGHPIYQLTFPNANRTFLYDDQTGIWYEAQTGVALIGRHYANLGITFNTKNYICDANTGNIYQLDPKTYTDNGVTIKRQVCSRHIRLGGNEFSISEVVLEMNTGMGLPTGQGSNPKIMMQISRDGGRTFGAERWKTIGKLGQYRTPTVKFDRLGSAIDFVFKWTLTDPIPFEITLAEATVEPGVINVSA